MKTNKQNKPNKSMSKTKRDNRPKSQSSIVKRNSDSPNCGIPDNVHVSGSINDASYYFSNELLKNQVTNISFNNFTGVPVGLSNYYFNTETNINIPTTMTIALNPSAGFTDRETGLGSALNLMALKMYTELSANNAKTTNYAPQDIMCLFLALGSAISLSSHISRVMGLAYLYNQRNYSMPAGLIQSLGVDYDDLIDHLADYRVRFNAIMNSASAIAFPQNVTYFKKCNELYAGVYLDMEGSPMAQTYAFVPNSVWRIDEVGTSSGTVLRPVPIYEDPNSPKTMGVLLNTLDTLFTALLSSSTLRDIYSDVMRLARTTSLPTYTFEGIPDAYVVLPSYNPEIRKWINNLSIMGEPVNDPIDGYTAGNMVMCDVETNKIVYKPQFTFTNAVVATERILNFDYGSYTNDDIIYATRLMASAKYIRTEDNRYLSTTAALPDHYVTSINFFDQYGFIDKISAHVMSSGTIKQAMLLSAFDWSPIFPIGRDGTNNLYGIFGDLNFYTDVDFDYLSRLQDVTYYGLFEIR